ncbi:hypothetical protein SDC9_91265 [bioreactor metagenome]|uniref:Uncharacterized protein n=1 Tax=bioreactor metagenome TaxID=1076179 RepID=A0A644ZV40_9ZZZZ
MPVELRLLFQKEAAQPVDGRAQAAQAEIEGAEADGDEVIDGMVHESTLVLITGPYKGSASVLAALMGLDVARLSGWRGVDHSRYGGL